MANDVITGFFAAQSPLDQAALMAKVTQGSFVAMDRRGAFSILPPGTTQKYLKVAQSTAALNPQFVPMTDSKPQFSRVRPALEEAWRAAGYNPDTIETVMVNARHGSGQDEHVLFFVDTVAQRIVGQG